MELLQKHPHIIVATPGRLLDLIDDRLLHIGQSDTLAGEVVMIRTFTEVRKHTLLRSARRQVLLVQTYIVGRLLQVGPPDTPAVEVKNMQ